MQLNGCIPPTPPSLGQQAQKYIPPILTPSPKYSCASQTWLAQEWHSTAFSWLPWANGAGNIATMAVCWCKGAAQHCCISAAAIGWRKWLVSAQGLTLNCDLKQLNKRSSISSASLLYHNTNTSLALETITLQSLCVSTHKEVPFCSVRLRPRNLYIELQQ